MTLGEYRVGVDFNPGGNVRVNHIKQTIADLIDYVGEHSPGFNHEQWRVVEVARDRLEEAAMWAVKSVTKPAPPSGD